METRAYLRVVAALPLMLVGIVACSALFQDGHQRVVGFIDNGGLPIKALIVPDTVRARVSFTATVSTFGSSCFRPDGAEVKTNGLVVSVTPYDVAPPPGSMCTADFGAHPRSVKLTFAAPGTGLVRLRGRGLASSSLTLEDSVAVRP